MVPSIVRTAMPGADAGCALSIDENTEAGAVAVPRRVQDSGTDDAVNGATEETASPTSVNDPSAADFSGRDEEFYTDGGLGSTALISMFEVADELVDDVPCVTKKDAAHEL